MKYNVSEITALIKDRRTIYPEQFSSRKVHQELIEALLNAAIWAPTHGNTQPWRFQVFGSNEAREKLSDFLAETYVKLTPQEQQNDMKLAKMLSRPKLASCVIAVTMERGEKVKIPKIEELHAVACGIQNMHLLSSAQGLGFFWSTPKLIYTQEMKTFLNLKDEDECLGLIYLGYPAIEWPKHHRKPIEYITQWF